MNLNTNTTTINIFFNNPKTEAGLKPDQQFKISGKKRKEEQIGKSTHADGTKAKISTFSVEAFTVCLANLDAKNVSGIKLKFKGEISKEQQDKFLDALKPYETKICAVVYKKAGEKKKNSSEFAFDKDKHAGLVEYLAKVVAKNTK